MVGSEVSKYIDNVRSKASQTYAVDENAVHMGHAILQVFAEFPDFIAQVDAVSGVSNTFSEVSKSTVSLALALKKDGFKSGDVILLLLPNHLHTCLPMYAGLLNGMPVLPIEPSFRQKEGNHFVKLSKPKIVFCVKDNENLALNVLYSNSNDAQVVVIDDDENDIETYIKRHRITDIEIGNFILTVFDLNAPALLLPTSGTTGLPKIAIYSHHNLFFGIKNAFVFMKKCPKPTKAAIMLTTLQWGTSLMLYCSSALCVITRIQATVPFNGRLSKKTFAKYKPTLIMCSPVTLLGLNRDDCDLSSLEFGITGGTSLIDNLDKELKARYPNTFYATVYGMTETFGMCFVLASCGPYNNIEKEFSNNVFEYRLVDTWTGTTIKEPSICGELWIKHKSPFQGYYKNPPETAAAFSKDGYLKTGDLLYKDTEGYYYFVEIIKMMMKFKGYPVYPTEIEELLKAHPAVFNAAVTNTKDIQYGDIPVGIVVLNEGSVVTANELREIVRKELSGHKQLRGGIIFVDALPLTVTGKINRSILCEFIIGKKVEF